MTLFAPTVALADMRIIEIMYDLEGTDTGREWVEIQNTGATDIDMADWKFYEANTNHRLTPQSSSVIAPGGVAVIADNVTKFLADWPAFSGILFDSAFSLSNEGEALSLRDPSGTDRDTVSYTSSQGATGDGMSLSYTNGQWVATSPSPGSHGSASASTPSSTGTATSLSSTSPPIQSIGVSASHSSQSVANESGDMVVLSVSAGRDRLGFVGTPLSFEAKVRTPTDLASVSVAHRWSMGDGMSKGGQFISHTYAYPGEYIVVLNSEYKGESAVARVRVRIVSPDVSLRRATNEYIDIANDGMHELNLGGWIVESGTNRFVIPQDTIVLPNASVRLPYTSTRLRPSGDVVLRNPSSVVIAQMTAAPASPVLTPDSLIVLDGMTETEIRDRFTRALSQSSYAQSQSVVSTHVATLPEKTINQKDPERVVPTRSISSTTQVASVIYTVNTESRGFWSMLWRRIVGD